MLGKPEITTGEHLDAILAAPSRVSKETQDFDSKSNIQKRIERLKQDVADRENQIMDFENALQVIFPKGRPTLGGSHYDLGQKHLEELNRQLEKVQGQLSWEQDAFYSVSKK